MAKNPDERYQSAWGIQKDLETCGQELEAKGKIANFPLASQDLSNRLQISQKLYGRENEIESLLKTFEEVCDQENPTSKIMLVSGYSGIGKSRLVKAIYRPITEVKGYFITGKFDQYQRNIPYSAISQALSELIEYLLVESEASLQQWRRKILEVLGDNARVIMDVIPQLELILGEQPKVPALPAKGAENRFNILFKNFLKLFCRKEHPLVLFLDDLQWIDSASLRLMQLIITAGDIEYLFIIGAYRDNEVNAVHPLMLAIEELEKVDVTVERIFLLPLKLSHVNNLIADSLNCTRERAQPLAALVLAKTKGNPFFVKEFLRSLDQEKLLYFDYQARSWQWNLESIKTKNITDNVVELLSLEIKKLKPQTRQILQLAACIGNQFEIETLAIVAGNTPQKIALLLREAMITGLVYSVSRTHEVHLPF